MKGSCFCGEVAFEITGEITALYQCHCSECRKTTGTAANAGFILNKDKFKWIKGKALIKTFLKDSGYRVNFCTDCGSVVPNPMTMLPQAFWVPAGSIDDDFSARITNHICMDSKADWDIVSATNTAKHHSALPDDLAVLLPADLLPHTLKG